MPYACKHARIVRFNTSSYCPLPHLAQQTGRALARAAPRPAGGRGDIVSARPRAEEDVHPAASSLHTFSCRARAASACDAQVPRTLNPRAVLSAPPTLKEPTRPPPFPASRAGPWRRLVGSGWAGRAAPRGPCAARRSSRRPSRDGRHRPARQSASRSLRPYLSMRSCLLSLSLRLCVIYPLYNLRP